MAKKPKTTAEDSSSEERPDDLLTFSLRAERGFLAAFDAYCKSLRFKPSRQIVVLDLMEAELKRVGLWPPQQGEPSS